MTYKINLKTDFWNNDCILYTVFTKNPKKAITACLDWLDYNFGLFYTLGFYSIETELYVAK
ncbi:MAG: hypothetical protein K6G88_11820 [Lachnospiraceae bacterium]|nr:hypothetical protein [Lachnospiraceae bacterium]